MTSQLDEAVRNAPSDTTEIVYLETVRRRTAHAVSDATEYHTRNRTTAIRVFEGGREGQFRCGHWRRGELASAIRAALATAAASKPQRGLTLPGESEPAPTVTTKIDPEIARLRREDAKQLLADQARDDEAAIVEWCVGQVALANSNDLRRSAQATSIFVEVRSGKGAGAGFATDSARSIDELDISTLFERARARRIAPDAPRDEPPAAVAGIVLSPEATIELLGQLSRWALSAHSYEHGESFLREHTGVQVFDRRLELVDDGTDVAGLPFGFDLEGRTKRRTELVVGGEAKTPTLDLRTAAAVGLPATCQCVGGGDALPMNLFFPAGEASESELCATVGEGLWIGRLEDVSCFDPSRMQLRARCRGVRRIRDGRIVSPVQDLVWSDSLLRVFSNLLGVGGHATRRTTRDGLLGGVCAPAVAVAGGTDLEPY